MIQLSQPNSNVRYQIMSPMPTGEFVPQSLVARFELAPRSVDGELPVIHPSEEIVLLERGTVDVIIDGKSVATYAQKEIEKAGGKISYMIEGASEPQKIEAAALDMAGNETTSEMHKVLVTSSVWIQYINNTPLLIGSILGIVLVAGGLIWFFVIRKKKEESK